jgi:hypothetical protein
MSGVSLVLLVGTLLAVGLMVACVILTYNDIDRP